MPVFSRKEAEDYLGGFGLMELLNRASESKRLPPDLPDLARLYYMATTRNAFTVLEFGVGWSTLILAAAMRANELAWERLAHKPIVRSHDPFRVHSVDTTSSWVESTRQLLPSQLAPYAQLSCTSVTAASFGNRLCHFYDCVPDVVPDFIYLDGPDPATVTGELRGLSWRNPDRTVIAGDLLSIEPTLAPGTCLLIDGRTNNARFLRNNLQRRWAVEHRIDADVTCMELQEPPLGKINESTLQYCLGDNYAGFAAAAAVDRQ